MRLDHPGEAGDESDPNAEQWSRLEHLVATVADGLQKIENKYTGVNFKGKPPKFEPIPRPGVSSNTRKKGKPARLSAEQNDALFAHLRATQG